jgi:putative tryptophan/tyrosine transport system substrate-binding protein
MRRRDFVAGVGGAVVWPLFASAQEPHRPVIGFLSAGSPHASSTFVAAFLQGLREQGYVEGRDVWIEYRWAEGQYDQLVELADDLVRDRVAVIAATGGDISANAAMKATSTIPIVFVIGSDPVKLGFVPRVGRPGGNSTGASLFSQELVSKRLEVLKEALGLRNGNITIGLVVNPGALTTDIEITDTLKAAEQLNKAEQRKTTEHSKFDVIVLKASTESEIEAAVLSANLQRAAALLFEADPFFTTRRDQIVALVARHAIPAMYPWREYVKEGGLMSYGTEITWGYHLIGVYAGRILKGQKPYELPVELPAKFQLVINLKTAKALGLTIPETLLATADEVIQ